ncbi:hypothetical protein CEXT_403091 [Caerostris extrusa]|uniref:Uncharacterized protein n=1 Tax=Caerostris extrusa TaxID=172846 RepID=A0AAV4QSR7_CAEEX|nr:hypothetical protein CEXT_403091 [Caerostris extrusa]
MNDSTIDVDQLIDAVTHALPALEATDDHHMKAVILLKHYNYLNQNHNVPYFKRHWFIANSTPELESTEATIIILNIGNKNQITFISILQNTSQI